jgi:hypothetical protein
MDETGGAYGADPYGDAGHAYAHGYEYGGSVGTDTGTMSWDSAELAQWTHSEYSTHATGTDSYATGTHPYVAGPDPATAEWDSPHGDVLTVGPPEFDAGAPLLISTMLGGPGISSPFVPQPDSTHPTTPRATAPDASPGTGHAAGNASPTAGQRNSGPAVRKTPGPTDRSAASTAPAATSGPTGAPTRITSSTAAPAPISTPTRKGRANGSSHHPVK